MAYDHTHCLVRGLPASFADGLKLVPAPVPIDVDIAAQQHTAYVTLMRELVPTLLLIPADESHPDCVFIEDSAVVAAGRAVIARSGAPSRRAEVGPVRAALLTLFPLPGAVTDLLEPATLDGGDVLLAGGALWVGLSSRTNAAAVEQLAVAFHGRLPVLSFDVGGGTEALHLKSLMTSVDETTLVVMDCAPGRALVAQAQAKPELAGRLTYAYVQDLPCCNVVRVGGTVVHPLGFPASEAVLRGLCKARGLAMRGLEYGELSKADAALTCCSVLFRV